MTSSSVPELASSTEPFGPALRERAVGTRLRGTRIGIFGHFIFASRIFFVFEILSLGVRVVSVLAKYTARVLLLLR